MSSFLVGMEVAASGLSAQRTRMNVVSSNLANAETTRTAEGGPYRRRMAVFQAMPVEGFKNEMDSAITACQLADVRTDPNAKLEQVYDPSHPDSNAEGFVSMPNVNVVTEMVDMVTASRSYEASATAFEQLKSMAMRALSIGRF